MRTAPKIRENAQFFEKVRTTQSSQQRRIVVDNDDDGITIRPVNLELLQAISLGVAQERRMPLVLSSIVSGLVQSAGFALARIWLLDRSGSQPMLQLAASGGRSQVDGQSWDRLDGEFRCIPMSARKIGHIAATGEPLLLREEVSKSHWTAHPDWVQREGIQAFAGHPLLFLGEVLGVLAVFSREPASGG